MATKRKKTGNTIAGKTEKAVRKAVRAVKRMTAGKQYGNLHELLILKLQNLYDIEIELTKALPKLAKAAHNRELRAAFEDHLRETRGHVGRLEEAMRLLGGTPIKERARGIRGIAEDGEWVAEHTRGAARDAGLIAAAQYAEHYEIAGYGTAREWAAMMDHADVADLLDATLMEEENANKKLSELAHNGINQRAGGIPMEEHEEEEIPLM